MIETLCSACGRNMFWSEGQEWQRCDAEDDNGEVCETMNYWPGGARGD